MNGAVEEQETQRLAQAYAATTYRVLLPDGGIDVFVGCASPALAALVGGEDWAIVTAENPGSRQVTEADNEQANRRLADTLQAAGWQVHPVLNLSADGQWPVERAFLVVGIDRDAACALGHRFGQRAVLVGGRNRLPTLCWMSTPSP